MRWLEERPDISSSMAASSTNELWLKIGEAHIIRPALGVDDDRMRALMVAAINDQKARTVARSHLPKSDFLWVLHGLRKRGGRRIGNQPQIAARSKMPQHWRCGRSGKNGLFMNVASPGVRRISRAALKEKVTTAFPVQ